MSQKGRVDRLVDVLNRYGFYEGDPKPGVFSKNVEAGLNQFLLSPKGDGVKRVVNALKIFDRIGFSHIPKNTDCITADVRMATKALLENYNKENLKRLSEAVKSKPDIEYMKIWETGGVTAF